jgi:hypothetical protein
VWESNQPPSRCKLLNPLPWLLRFGRIRAQNLGHLLHGISLRITYDMRVDPERSARIGVAELRLCHLGRRTYFEQQTRMGMVTMSAET